VNANSQSIASEIYFVLTATTKGLSPSFAVDVLERLSTLFQDYCGSLAEDGDVYIFDETVFT
jgi:hypothetical protein